MILGFEMHMEYLSTLEYWLESQGYETQLLVRATRPPILEVTLDEDVEGQLFYLPVDDDLEEWLLVFEAKLDGAPLDFSQLLGVCGAFHQVAPGATAYVEEEDCQVLFRSALPQGIDLEKEDMFDLWFRFCRGNLTQLTTLIAMKREGEKS